MAGTAEEPLGNAAYWLIPPPIFIQTPFCLSYTTQAYFPQDSTTHSGLGPLHQLASRKCLWDMPTDQSDEGNSPNLRSLFPGNLHLVSVYLQEVPEYFRIKEWSIE